MTGYYLAEFSISYKPVRHGRPGIGATHSSRFVRFLRPPRLSLPSLITFALHRSPSSKGRDPIGACVCVFLDWNLWCGARRTGQRMPSSVRGRGGRPGCYHHASKTKQTCPLCGEQANLEAWERATDSRLEDMLGDVASVLKAC